jgi:site-specific recombinase XerD
MSPLAPTLQSWFSQRLTVQRQASAQTIAAYRDSMKLLLCFAQHRTRKAPSQLDIADLDAELISAFLDHLETERHNSVRTRNARLAAIHSLFSFAALRHPEHAALIARVLAIPPKQFDRADVSFLTKPEAEALLACPDRSTWIGRRDHALLLIAVQTGLRVSELTGLHCSDIILGRGAHLLCQGKGRKRRSTPLLAQSTAVITEWLRERQGAPGDILFPSRRGSPLSPDAVQFLLNKYAAIATTRCPSLRTKHLSPHVLRHTAAMFLREAGIDISVIALILGHENIQSTQIYQHADLAMKERALARTAPIKTAARRYRPNDTLLAYLENL